jgi:hypothetical protein
VKIDWLVGLISIEGRFSRPTRVESDSCFAVCSQGSMSDESVHQIFHHSVVARHAQDSSFDKTTGKHNE